MVTNGGTHKPAKRKRESAKPKETSGERIFRRYRGSCCPESQYPRPSAVATFFRRSAASEKRKNFVKKTRRYNPVTQKAQEIHFSFFLCFCALTCASCVRFPSLERSVQNTE